MLDAQAQLQQKQFQKELTQLKVMEEAEYAAREMAEEQQRASEKLVEVQVEEVLTPAEAAKSPNPYQH